MKRLNRLYFGLCILLLSSHSQAQSKMGADYFAGKWNVLVKGLPNGDTKMSFVFEEKDTTLSGMVMDSTGKQISKIDSIVLTGMTATVYFVAQGYDVNLVMNKKDEDHITGSLMGMFDAEGDRVKVSQ
jgi:hypothetical protein